MHKKLYRSTLQSKSTEAAHKSHIAWMHESQHGHEDPTQNYSVVPCMTIRTISSKSALNSVE